MTTQRSAVFTVEFNELPPVAGDAAAVPFLHYRVSRTRVVPVEFYGRGSKVGGARGPWRTRPEDRSSLRRRLALRALARFLPRGAGLSASRLAGLAGRTPCMPAAVRISPPER